MGSQQDIDSTKLHEAKSYVKKSPNITSGYIDLASNHFMAKNYAKAIKILEKALVVAKTEQEKEMIYYNLAIAYYSIDNTKLATDYLRNSMRIRDTEEKRYLLAEIYTKDGNLTKAADEYMNLIKHHPENIEYIIGLTNIYVVEKKYLKARATLKSFLKNNPLQRNNERLESYGILMMFL
jgi:tetratricopeptide (TPR) repeat protein